MFDSAFKNADANFNSRDYLIYAFINVLTF